MRTVLNSGNLSLTVILICALASIVISDQFKPIPIAHSVLNNTQSLRLNGPINSLQYSNDGDVLFIVSGRWRMDAAFDKTGSLPLSVKNFTSNLIVLPVNETSTPRYQLSDFKQDSISYDNETKTSSIKGKLTMLSEAQSITDIAVVLKLINKNILTITLDPSKTREHLGETPIYGIER